MGITENEWAGKLVKKGTGILQLNNNDVSFSSIKTIIKNAIGKKLWLQITRGNKEKEVNDSI